MRYRRRRRIYKGILYDNNACGLNEWAEKRKRQYNLYASKYRKIAIYLHNNRLYFFFILRYQQPPYHQRCACKLTCKGDVHFFLSYTHAIVVVLLMSDINRIYYMPIDWWGSTREQRLPCRKQIRKEIQNCKKNHVTWIFKCFILTKIFGVFGVLKNIMRDSVPPISDDPNTGDDLNNYCLRVRSNEYKIIIIIIFTYNSILQCTVAYAWVGF